ncbi:hypothetical protein AB0O30_35220, partial [Streptomyces sp. NPDC091215]
GEYLLGGATSSSFPCSGQPYWVPVRKLRGPSYPGARQHRHRHWQRRAYPFVQRPGHHTRDLRRGLRGPAGHHRGRRHDGCGTHAPDLW